MDIISMCRSEWMLECYDEWKSNTSQAVGSLQKVCMLDEMIMGVHWIPRLLCVCWVYTIPDAMYLYQLYCSSFLW